MIKTDKPAKTVAASASASASATATAVEMVTCDTCGFVEECTAPYIRHVRDRYEGMWLCGLCTEAVKNEFIRSPTHITIDEALRRHSSFCHRFRRDRIRYCSDTPISVIGRILRRRLDESFRTAVRTSSSGALQTISTVDSPSAPSSQSLLRSGSCFQSLSTS